MVIGTSQCCIPLGPMNFIFTCGASGGESGVGEVKARVARRRVVMMVIGRLMKIIFSWGGGGLFFGEEVQR